MFLQYERGQIEDEPLPEAVLDAAPFDAWFEEMLHDEAARQDYEDWLAQVDWSYDRPIDGITQFCLDGGFVSLLAWLGYSLL